MLVIQSAEEYNSSKFVESSTFLLRVERKDEASGVLDETKSNNKVSNYEEAQVEFEVSKTTMRSNNGGSPTEVPLIATCKSCGKVIGPPVNFGALQSHTMYCTRSDLYHCKCCKERFHRQSALDMHMFREHGLNRSDKELSCSFCGKGFDRKQLLLKHLKRTKCGDIAMKRKALDEQDTAAGAKKRLKGKIKTEKYSFSGGEKNECKPVALVNHCGHVDWLMSCNTLMCSEERTNTNCHDKDHGHASGDLHHHGGSGGVGELKSGQECSHYRGCSHSFSFSKRRRGSLCEEDCPDHKNEDKFMRCPHGCEQNTECEHIAGAKMVKHNDHWDHVMDDHLIHVFDNDRGGISMVDHGLFEILDKNLDIPF